MADSDFPIHVGVTSDGTVQAWATIEARKSYAGQSLELYLEKTQASLQQVEAVLRMWRGV